MPKAARTGVPILGVIFLALGLFKMVQGEAWVVWFVLGIVFGGLGVFNLKRSGGTQA